MDANGVQVGYLGGVIDKLSVLREDNIKLSERIDAIKADVTAQGGVMLGHHTFSSEIQVMQVAMAECPQGDAFSLLVDPMSLFCQTQCTHHCLAGRKSQRPWKNQESCSSLAAR